MREIVSPLSGIRSPFGGRVDPYKVLGFKPTLVADMSKDYFRNPSRQTFDDIFTTSRLGNATMVDSDGLVKWGPHNLTLNSATPATQSITVVSGADYTVECTGSGSITLSGAGTGTVTEGSLVEVTASTTSLTLTIVGSVDLMWCYRSDLGGMAPVPSDARVAGSTTYVPTTSTAKYLPRRHNHTYNGSAWVDAGTLIETEARTNYQTSIGAGIGVTVSSGISGSPSGASDANRFSKDATDPRYAVIDYNLTVSSNTAYTVSAYFKWDGHDMITSLEFNNIAYFDVAWRVDFLATSSGISISTEANATGNVEDVGNGWYRCSATFTSGASATGVNPNSLVQLTGGDGASILIYGAQLEAGSTPSSYIPTSGSTDIRAADSPLTVAGADVPWPTPTVIGDELVTNGGFDTDTSGWSGNNATLSSVSGQLVVTPTTTNPTAYAPVTLVVGKVYLIEATLVDVNGSPNAKSLQVGTGATGNQMFSMSFGTTPQTLSGAFVATATTGYVNVYNFDGTNAAVWDNISVKEINPLSVCIQMEGDMTYADENTGDQLYFVRWEVDTNNKILERVRSNVGTGDFTTQQTASGVSDVVSSGGSYFSPGINVPFNIASRHGSTFINGAVGGTALTADTTPVALPDLSSTDLQIAYDFMGNVKTVRVWAVDIGDTGIAEASS